MSIRRRWSPVCSPPDLVVPAPLDPAGRAGPTPGQARGTHWRQTTRGFYVPASVDGTVVEQRVLEQSMRLPSGGAVTGWASLRLHGAAFFDGRSPDNSTALPVPLVTGRGQSRRPCPEVSWLQDVLDAAEVRVRHGVPCTVALRALFDEMRRSADVRQATVAMDMAAAAQLTSIARMRRYLAEHPGELGVPVVREALELGSENSWSPAETRLRLVWVLDAGLPPPLVNREVFDRSGRLLGIADLLDLESGLVAEYDGGEHAPARQRSRDAARDGLFRDHGLEVDRFTGADAPDRRTTADRLRAARLRARWEPPERRSWTVEPPPNWPAQPSLDEVLAQRDLLQEEQERWEREGPPDIRDVRGF